MTLDVVIHIFQIILFFYLIGVLIYYFFLFFEIVVPYIFWGAIYVPSTDEKIKKMTSIIDFSPVEKAADLGAGDGRLVIALAQKGIESHEYEINPMLVWRGKRNINKAGLKGKAFIHWRNFWNENLSNFDIITVYGNNFIMKKLEKKLNKDLKNNTRVISNTFSFPTWLITKKEEGIYVYEKNNK